MIVFLSVSIIILSIIMFLYNWNIRNYNGFLAAYLITFAIYAIAHNQTFYSKNVVMIAFFWNNFSPLYLLSGPLLFFYTKATLEDKIVWRWYHLFHLLPTLLLFIGIIPYLFSSFEYKLDGATNIARDVNYITKIRMNSLFSNVFVYLSRPVIILAYVIASAILLIQKIKIEKEPTRQFRLVTRWISILLTTSFILMLLLAIMGSNLFKKDTREMLNSMQDLQSIAGTLLFILPITLLLFPQIFYGIPVREKEIEQTPVIESTEIEKNNSPQKKNQESFELLSQKILEYFDQEKPYLNPTFSLSSLAAAMNVPQHHISYCFNDFIDTSFTKLRASKRVEHAKNLLLQGITNQFTVEKVAELSGFSSRSTFFSTFKEYAGMTPSEFIEKSKQN